MKSMFDITMKRGRGCLTDLEKFKNLFSSVELLVDEVVDNNLIELHVFQGDDAYRMVELNDKQKRKYFEDGQKKVEGYPGFYVCFNFSLDGTFINIGIWE